MYLIPPLTSNSTVPEKEAQLKSHYDQLLTGLEKDLESQKDLVSRTQQELHVQREQVEARRLIHLFFFPLLFLFIF